MRHHTFERRSPDTSNVPILVEFDTIWHLNNFIIYVKRDRRSFHSAPTFSGNKLSYCAATHLISADRLFFIEHHRL